MYTNIYIIIYIYTYIKILIYIYTQQRDPHDELCPRWASCTYFCCGRPADLVIPAVME